MTEYEIECLIIEQANLLAYYLQIWLTITSTFIIVSYLVGGKIDLQLRKLVLTLYVLFSFATIFSWSFQLSTLMTLAFSTDQYGKQASLQSVFLGGPALVFQVLGFVIGMIGAIKYFMSTRPGEST